MKKFYRDVLDYVGATFLLKVVGLISFLYMGKLLPPSEFGYFATASVVVALGAMLAQFGAPGLILRNFHLEGGRTLIRALRLALFLWCGEVLCLRFLGNTLGWVNETFRGTADHPNLIGILVLTATFNVLFSSYLVTSLRARTFVVATRAKSVVYVGCVVALKNG